MLEKILRAVTLRAMIVVSLILCSPGMLFADSPSSGGANPTIDAKTSGMRHMPGFLPLHWDTKSGRLFLEIPRLNSDMLYFDSLPYGTGSNDLGLDRGQVSRAKLVRFERFGPRILLVQPNEFFRSSATDPAERLAVRQSFPESILGGFAVAAENPGGATNAGAVLVDATDFFTRDVHGVSDALVKQGSYKLDAARSAIAIDATNVFPNNTEVEAILTFASDAPTRGSFVGDVTPDAHALTVREHQSFLELPGPGYTPRRYDPRAGYFQFDYRDYAAPLGAPLDQRFIVRHRLIKQDPACTQACIAVKPIQYFVDRGAPEPIRGALVEGARWWDQAFQAAGWAVGTFRDDVLPEGVDPMDARYNIIQWVHRFTRGWSYGHPVADPRTGEIIKGNVTLGSLRDRQDYLIGSGLIPHYKTANASTNGNEIWGDSCDFGMLPDLEYLAAFDPATDAGAMAIARIRQLAAHEVGHTLGLAHNFAASTYGRASVMDYPAPQVDIKNGKLDLSNAYSVGIGIYDKFAITFAYSQFPNSTNEAVALNKIVTDGVAAGMLFISDNDARPAGAAHPLANLWDSGEDPIASLKHEMEVRRLGLSQFGLDSVPVGTPLSELEGKLVPLYLHHRYQLQAAVKSVGGLFYTYAIKSANGPNPAKVTEIVAASRQREALAAVLDTIKIDELVIPQRILELIPPRAFGYEGGTLEPFAKRTQPGFDPIAAATIDADMAISGLLEPHRAARLIEYHSRNSENPDFKEVTEALITRTWKAPTPKDPYAAAVARAVQTLTATRLMDLAADESASPEVRGVATATLRELNASLKSPSVNGASAHRQATRDDIERFLNRPDTPRKQTAPLQSPPGDPIGTRGQPNKP